MISGSPESSCELVGRETVGQPITGGCRQLVEGAQQRPELVGRQRLTTLDGAVAGQGMRSPRTQLGLRAGKCVDHRAEEGLGLRALEAGGEPGQRKAAAPEVSQLEPQSLEEIGVGDEGRHPLLSELDDDGLSQGSPLPSVLGRQEPVGAHRTMREVLVDDHQVLALFTEGVGPRQLPDDSELDRPTWHGR